MCRNSYRRGGGLEMASYFYLAPLQASVKSLLFLLQHKYKICLESAMKKSQQYSGSSCQHLCLKLKVRIIHSSTKSTTSKYVLSPNSVRINAVKAINYQGSFTLTRLLGSALLWTAGPCLALAAVTHRSCPVTPPSSQWSKRGSEQLLILLVFISLYLSSETL